MKQKSTASWVAFLLLCVVAQNCAAQSGDSTIGSDFFLGQAYPSGNVYIDGFLSEGSQPRQTFPTTLSLLPLPADNSAFKGQIVQATLSQAVATSGYIPAVEGMDDEHSPCGSGDIKKKEKGFQYLSDDLFQSMFDYCDSANRVRIYRGTASRNSVMVLGFASVQLTDVRAASGQRPLTAKERDEVRAQKARLARVTDCTTTPAFLDSAKRMLEATVVGRGLKVRLSSYETPGCLGHLVTIYLLDILRGDDVVQTLVMYRNRGVL